MTTAIRWSRLLACSPEAAQSLHLSFHRHGYALLQVDGADGICNQIKAGLVEASNLEGFRFPAINNTDPIQYNSIQRHCFCALYDIATMSFVALWNQHNQQQMVLKDELSWHRPAQLQPPKPALQSSINSIQDLLPQQEEAKHQETLHSSQWLFPSDHPHLPFGEDSTTSGIPFSSTFFNLFSYQHGMLNTHQDRGLLTVIASKQIAISSIDNKDSHTVQSVSSSRLWMESPHSEYDNNHQPKWIDLDTQIEQHQKQRGCSGDSTKHNDNDDDLYVVLLLGQAGETLLPPLQACRHTVRVNPQGPYVDHSHFRPDPDQQQLESNSNRHEYRVSAAMILNQEEDEEEV